VNKRTVSLFFPKSPIIAHTNVFRSADSDCINWILNIHTPIAIHDNEKNVVFIAFS